MSKKLVAVMTVLVAGSLSLSAQVSDKSVHKLAKNVTRTVTEQSATFDEAPFQQYKDLVALIKQPSYEALRASFKTLATYNKDFADSQKKGVWSKLATQLASPVPVGWNTYRTIGMMEIFEQYFPQENKDAEIALLEYNVKKNSVSKDQRSFTELFKDINDPSVKRFYKAYNQFVSVMQRTTAYNPQGIIMALIPMITAYDNMNDSVQGAAMLAKRSLFKEPILTGWGRTVTVDELRYKLGKCEMAGGDYVYTYPPERLQSLYNLHPSVADRFYQFVDNYTK